MSAVISPSSVEAASPPMSDEAILHFSENPFTTWQEEATHQEAAISPNVLSNHTSLPPNSSVPQGANYKVKPKI